MYIAVRPTFRRKVGGAIYPGLAGGGTPGSPSGKTVGNGSVGKLTGADSDSGSVETAKIRDAAEPEAAPDDPPETPIPLPFLDEAGAAATAGCSESARASG